MDYTVLCPAGGNEQSIWSGVTVEAFSASATDFIDDLSKTLLTDPRTRAFPELNAVGFWMRRSHIEKLKSRFFYDSSCRVGRGVVFHIAPSNVDTIFLYSWFISLLSGNFNIVRLSSQPSQQMDLLLGIVSSVSERHPDIARRFLLLRYDHSETITAHFSGKCDMRVIWGGDQTIRRIRSIPVPPTAKEITFADKFSLAAIKAGAYLASDNKTQLAERFFNDAFWFNQMACSSPRAVVWVGSKDDVAAARQTFWTECREVAMRRNHETESAGIMDKFVAQCSIAVDAPFVESENHYGNAINTLRLPALTSMPREFHCGNGLFFEAVVSQLDQLAAAIVRKDQTIVHFGFAPAELKEFVVRNQPKGIDRFVPFGKALEFSEQWDGFDLFCEFTRVITIEA